MSLQNGVKAATPDMVHASVGISQTDSIKVAVRVRPFNSKDQAHTSCVEVAEVRSAVQSVFVA
jgi:hypothetical protein